MLAFDGVKTIARTALSGTTAEAVRAFLKAACESGGAMYADGWTCVEDADTDGLALIPPGKDASFDDDLRILICGKAASIGTPTMALVEGVSALDTAQTGEVMVGMVRRNGATLGTFDWNAASGLVYGALGSPAYVFTGYLRCIDCASAAYISVIYTKEWLKVTVDNNANNTMRYFRAGAWLDPNSVAYGQDCEANGRLYAIATSGGGATTGIASLHKANATVNSATGNGSYVHGTADGNSHLLFMKPGDTSLSRLTQRLVSGGITDPAFHRSASGRRHPWPICYTNATASNLFAGWDRCMVNANNGRLMGAESNPDGSVGVLWGSGLTGDQEAYLFEATDQYTQ